MKKLLGILVLGLLITSTSSSNELIPLKKYLDDHPISNTAAGEAPTVIYMTIRCSGLYAFYAVIMKEKNPEAAAKFHDLAGEFAYTAAKLDSQFSDRSFDESLKNMIVAAEKIMKSYKKDGEDNWTKTGSFIQDSYIEDEDEICKDAKKNVMNQ